MLGHLQEDTQTLAEWGVDYVKVGGCNVDPQELDQGYPEVGRYLSETGRPIVYSCLWPLYVETNGMEPDFSAISSTCNLWRNWWNIDDSWASLTMIMDHFADRQDVYSQWAGPGHWNDPDTVFLIKLKFLNFFKNFFIH